MTLKTCPECSAEFAPTHGRQVFCTVAHKRAFHHLMAARGQFALPIALASRRMGNRKKGSMPELAGWSRRELCVMLDEWNRQDAAAGRRPDLIASGKMDARWLAIDTLRRPSPLSDI